MVGGVCSGCFEVLEGGGCVDGVPGDDGVGEEGEAFALYVLVFCSFAADLSLVGEEELSAEGVEGFAFVELAVDASAMLVVV